MMIEIKPKWFFTKSPTSSSTVLVIFVSSQKRGEFMLIDRNNRFVLCVACSHKDQELSRRSTEPESLFLFDPFYNKSKEKFFGKCCRSSHSPQYQHSWFDFIFAAHEEKYLRLVVGEEKFWVEGKSRIVWAEIPILVFLPSVFSVGATVLSVNTTAAVLLSARSPNHVWMFYCPNQLFCDFLVKCDGSFIGKVLTVLIKKPHDFVWISTGKDLLCVFFNVKNHFFFHGSGR